MWIKIFGGKIQSSADHLISLNFMLYVAKGQHYENTGNLAIPCIPELKLWR